jgi:hypothetical protein
MNPSAPRFLAVLLVIWGLFNMSFPLWRAARISQAEGIFAELPTSHFVVGLTAALAGLALFAVCARLDELAQAMPPAAPRPASQ